MQKKTKSLSEMTLEELWQLFPIIISEHDPAWADFYRAEKYLLTERFGDLLVRISHIGSTAVKGLAAKPTVDILLEVQSTSSGDMVRRIASDCGYLVMAETFEPEYRLDLCKGYTPQGFAEKVFHVHLRMIGDNNELYFRDYLNSHFDIAKEYEESKLSLWKKFEHDRDGYTEAKTEFIKKYTEKGKSLYGKK